jgi:integrase
VRYRVAGKPRKVTFDGALTLAAARKAAAEALHELERGNDPAALKSKTKATAATLAAETVERWAAQFIELHARRKTRALTLAQYESVLRRLVLPAWRGRTVHDIKRRDVIDLLEQIALDRPIMANRTLGVLSKFFNWLCERDAIVASPCAGVRRPSEEHARDRVLAADEIRRLWIACDAIGDPAGACIKTLLLTGQRRSEVSGMRRSEISGDVWSLPGERTKNKKRHDVPLSAQVLAIIESMPVITGSDYVFTFGRAPLGHFNRSKQLIDARMKPDAPWVLHDLRRTCASGMARLGVRLPVIEKCLNHSSGTFRGIVATYQRHDFAAEKGNALQRWADHVDAIVRGEPAEKVVRLRGA